MIKPGHRRRTVDFGSLVGCPSGRLPGHGPVAVEVFDQHLYALTDALGGPLIADLVDQGADHLVAIVDLVGIDLTRK